MYAKLLQEMRKIAGGAMRQEHRAEIEAVRVSGARMVTLGGQEAGNTFDQLQVLMCNWRAIERKLAQVGPFIYTATRAG